MLISQLNKTVSTEDASKESMVSIKKLCNLYFKATKYRDEGVSKDYLEISEKMRNEILRKLLA